MTRKILALLLCLLLLASAASAETVSMDLAYCGLRLPISEQLLNSGVDAYTNVDQNGYPYAVVYYLYAPLLSQLESDMMEAINSQDDDAVIDLQIKYNTHVAELLGVTLVPKADYDSALAAGKTAASLATYDTVVGDVQVVGESDGYVRLAYKLLPLTDEDLAEFDADEAAGYQACRDALGDILSGAELMDITELPGESALPDTMPEFATKDLDGNDVTNDIFAQKDLTVVNVWGTFCGPCISEMPELGEWSASLPDNVQLIGLVCDVNSYDDKEQVQAAQDIVKDTGAAFTHLVANGDLDALLNAVSAVPTTFFMDKEGNLVGEPVVGANVQAYKDFVDSYLK